MDDSPTPSPGRRPTTLTIPSLHLGSFDGISAESFPLPGSPSRLPSTYNSAQGSPSLGLKETGREGQTRVDGERDHSIENLGGSSRIPLNDQQYTVQRSSQFSTSPSTSTSTRSPSRPRHFVDPPTLPPPTMSLPPLPNISPVSPLKPPSPLDALNLFAPNSTSHTVSTLRLPTPPSLSSSRPSTAPSLSSSSSSPSGPKSPTDSLIRPLGPSLSIHVPPKHAPEDMSAVIRETPSVARRRTVIDASPAASRVSAIRMSQVLDTASPQHDNLLQECNPRTSSLERGSLIMPVARPTPPVDSHPAQFATQSPRRLEKKQSTNDLKNASPTSPTPRRSLPRPPANRAQPPPALVLNPITNLPPLTSHPPRTDSMRPQSTAMPSNILAPPNRVPLATFDSPKSPDLPQILPRSRHQPAKSASSMPIVAGLADGGPYPSAAPTQYAARQSGNAGPSGVGLGRLNTGQPTKRQPPPEEVCIECMMRDRDLADVIVSGEGVWERKSDIAWEDMKAREDEILRSMGSDSVLSTSLPSLDHSTGSDEEDSASLPSTHHSYEDGEARRRAVARNAKREQKRARRREIDWRIIKECGWRGFKWEEGQNGEGLPRSFRGGRGGPLTEEAIKAVMTKFPSASAHRAKWLDNYLYHQAILVREIRAEAQRVGHYPGPGEVPFSSGSVSDNQRVIAGPRTSSVAWGDKHARELSEQMKGAFNTPTQAQPAAPYATVRPSPSSPAELSNLAKRPQAPPLTRPLTQLYPEREVVGLQKSPISGGSMREQQRKSVSSAKTLDRSLRTADDWHDNDSAIWPPVSPAESGLRPFSFAVRAGAVGGRGSSDGHGRRSLFGRWGGSVTSFFGGSQGGSGSMMDMHLGLDNDRQNRTMSSYVHNQPRAVSLASPSRPSFFGRDSRASSVHGDIGRERQNLSKSISASRLSQILRTEPDEEPMPEKKKGFKGFLKKIKPKAHKKEPSRGSRPAPSPRMDEQSDLGTPLAPPPPMSYLAGRGDRQQTRDRSGSTSTMVTDNSSAVAPRGSAALPYGIRSVSAPQPGSSSGGSQSASPTSSRYNRRESYASARDVLDADRERRGSGVEVLAGRSFKTSPDVNEGNSGAMRNQLHTSTYPPPTIRPHNKTTSSLSNSSLLMPTVETPPPGVNGAYAFFQHQSLAQNGALKAQTVQTSPNRFKNLPPLPPPGQDAPLSTSPDSLSGGFGGIPPPDFTRRVQERRSSGQLQGRTLDTGTFGSPRGQGYGQEMYAQPRASYDHQDNRSHVRPVDTRNVRSMYTQPSAVGSVGSFGMAPNLNGNRQSGGYPGMTVGSMGSIASADDGRAPSKNRKGLKSFFGGAKAGRVA